MTTIDKIRAEIDRRYGEYKAKFHQNGDSYHLGIIDGLDMAERILDTLEEPVVYRLNGLMQDYIKEGKDDEEKEHRFKCYQLFWDALEDTSYFEQEEQKPETRDADDLQLLGFIYDLLNEIEWNDNWAMSKDECLRRLNNYRPQKPAWSEEDEDMLNNIEYILHKDISYTPPTKPNSCTGSGNAYYTHQTEIDWLKSLRSHPKSSNNSRN